MSQTRLLCEKCGYPQCYCKCRPPAGSSARASVATAGPVSSLAVATGSLPGLSAERLICRWESTADMCCRAARDYERDCELARSRQAQDRAYAFAQCAKELRAEMEAATERQPEENVPDQPRSP